MRFRRQIFLSFVLIFIIFSIFMFPVVTGLIEMIQEENLHARTKELIDDLDSASDFDEMIKKLKERERYIFFDISLFDSSGNYLFDTHSLEGGFDDEKRRQHNEVEAALQTGSGYEVRYAPIAKQKMAFMAIKFTFRGQEYVLRTAFPYGQIAALTHDLTLAIFFLGICALLLFGFLAWFIIHVLTRPIQEIINAIKPYQLGEVEHIPEIKLGKAIKPGDEFAKLAETFNSLSRHIDHQISSLIQEKNEKVAILESLIEGVIAVDATRSVIYMNRMAEVFLNIKEKELVGKNFSLAKQPLCEELIQEATKKGQPALLVLKPDRKQKRYLDVIAVPRDKGGAILVLQDKTGLHVVVERGRDFIANASHELKTPITIIRGFAETLHDHPELTAEVTHEITQKIVNNCQRMDTLVKNLLTLAAVDEGLPRSRLQECDIEDLVEQAKQTILSVHPNAHIRLTTKGREPFLLMVDSDLLFQAILNLLDNAVKYSKPPAEVEVRIEKYPKEFIIRVSDKGIGIPQEDQDRIFERFYAVNKSHSRSLGGSGLGLSIVERIIEKHEGKIEVESEMGKGTTFIISLPIYDY